jgi:hypothetical protein
MATSQEQYITDPAQLREFNLFEQPSNSSLPDGTVNTKETATQHSMPPLRLALLQPLACPVMFAACRNPAQESTHRSDDRKAIDHEYLDISALDKAWRHALSKAPPVSQITFDLRLPKPVGDGEAPVQTIYWDTAMPPNGQHFGVSPRSVMRLVATIATVARMRVEGDVHFKLSYDEAEDISTRAISLLSTRLEAIAKAKNNVSAGTLGIGKVDVESDNADAAGDDEKPGLGRGQKV